MWLRIIVLFLRIICLDTTSSIKSLPAPPGRTNYSCKGNIVCISQLLSKECCITNHYEPQWLTSTRFYFILLSQQVDWVGGYGALLQAGGWLGCSHSWSVNFSWHGLLLEKMSTITLCLSKQRLRTVPSSFTPKFHGQNKPHTKFMSMGQRMIPSTEIGGGGRLNTCWTII